MKALPSVKTAALTLAAALFGATASRGQTSVPITVNEYGVGANETVKVGSSTIGSNVNVYAGLLKIDLNGVSTYGFCVDPWDWSGTGNLTYDTAALANAPGSSAAGGVGMGAQTALQIEQLWQEYFSPTMSNSAAAGLQIAIWELVGSSVSAATDGSSWFQLDSSNNYGASTDIAWVDSHTNAAAANLTGLTGPGQAYAVATSAIPPVITSALTATGKLNESFSYSVAAAGIPTSFAASGLPTGLSINTSTGLISGAPSEVGTYQVKLTASNSTTSDSATLSLTIAQTYTLVLAASPSGAGSCSGEGTYDPGTVVNICETANSDYRTAGWAGTDGAKTASPSSASTTITMSGNRNVTADFVRQAILTVTVGAGGTATGSGTYDIGSSATITATPTGNFAFLGWSGTGIVNSAASTTTVTITGNEIVTGNFLAPPVFSSTNGSQILVVGQPYSLPLSATNNPTFSAASLPPGLSISPSTGLVSGTPTGSGTWSGTVVASNAAGSADQPITFSVYNQPSITSATSAGGLLNETFGFTVTATGSPTSYSATGLPAGLSIDPATGIISGTPSVTGSFPVTLTASNPGASGSATLNLNVAQTYVLAISGAPSAGGTFTGSGTYPAGTVVTISEAAGDGYRAAGWAGADGASTASPSSTSTTIVMTANRNLVADFVQQATLTVNAGSGGSATGSGTYDVGTTVTINATPSANYSFSDWTGDATASAGSASTTVTLAGNETVDANFALIPQPPTATINAAPTAYTGSPFTVTSTASAPDDNLTLHSIEWLSPDGTWSTNTTTVSGETSNRSLGITFPTTGSWTVRAGASVDGGNTWVYSPNAQVVVSAGITTYTLQTMAVPSSGLLNWYAPSPVVTKTYQVQHVNP